MLVRELAFRSIVAALTNRFSSTSFAPGEEKAEQLNESIVASYSADPTPEGNAVVVEQWGPKAALGNSDKESGKGTPDTVPSSCERSPSPTATTPPFAAQTPTVANKSRSQLHEHDDESGTPVGLRNTLRAC